MNSGWESRERMWYQPINFVNFVDQRLYTEEYTLSKRYLSMLYQATIMIGGNEMGPINKLEYVFMAMGMISAAFLNALLFGNVASLIAVLSKKQTER